MAAASHKRPTLWCSTAAPGFDHTYFKPFLSELADTCQIVYVDLRGQGRSARPPVETCTLEQMADDVAALSLRPRHRATRHPRPLGGRVRRADTGSPSPAPRGAVHPRRHRRGHRGHG